MGQGGALVGAAAAGAWLGCRPMTLTAGAAAGIVLGETWHWKTWDFAGEKRKYSAAIMDIYAQKEEEMDLIHQEHVRKILAACKGPLRHAEEQVVGDEEGEQEGSVV